MTDPKPPKIFVDLGWGPWTLFTQSTRLLRPCLWTVGWATPLQQMSHIWYLPSQIIHMTNINFHRFILLSPKRKRYRFNRKTLELMKQWTVFSKQYSHANCRSAVIFIGQMVVSTTSLKSIWITLAESMRNYIFLMTWVFSTEFGYTQFCRRNSNTSHAIYHMDMRSTSVDADPGLLYFPWDDQYEKSSSTPRANNTWDDGTHGIPADTYTRVWKEYLICLNITNHFGLTPSCMPICKSTCWLGSLYFCAISKKHFRSCNMTLLHQGD